MKIDSIETLRTKVMIIMASIYVTVSCSVFTLQNILLDNHTKGRIFYPSTSEAPVVSTDSTLHVVNRLNKYWFIENYYLGLFTLSENIS